MADYVGKLELMSEPVCIVWGDQNHLAPAGIRETYCALSANRKCQAVDVLPRVKHGFMMSGNAAAFDSNAYRMLDELRRDCCGDVRRGWNFCFGSEADVLQVERCAPTLVEACFRSWKSCPGCRP